MGLFRKRCTYCNEKIEKDKELFADVTVLGYAGTSNKPFCSDEHVNEYNEEIKNKPKGAGGSCCG